MIGSVPLQDRPRSFEEGVLLARQTGADRYRCFDRGFLPERERPSLVWIFECKDYAGSIPVDDIEEFHAKLQQIGEDNTKGTFVTSGALQRSALAYAQAKGIGVIRLLPGEQIIVVFD